MYIHRAIEKNIASSLQKDKSILLLGPRQTGKTTLINRLAADTSITLANPRERLRYEKEPFLLTGEIESLAEKMQGNKPLIIIDEIQKIPLLMDAVQDLIDRKVAKFILTGSSARKLRRSGDVNLLPGRVIPLRLDPLMESELIPSYHALDYLLIYGSLPEITLQQNNEEREQLLDAYVTTYLEEEIRAEAIVRDLGNFSRFLELAALESGKIVNFSKLSQEIGITHATIGSYYQILEDCLIAERIEPISHSTTRKKLSKTQKYIFYDLGVRRVAAREGDRQTPEQLGRLFEQYITLELIRLIRIFQQRYAVKYWRDPNGPEVDVVIEMNQKYIPIEIKWTESPKLEDVKYLQIFLSEYSEATKGFIICRTPKPLKITENIYGLPWDRVSDVFN